MLVSDINRHLAFNSILADCQHDFQKSARVLSNGTPSFRVHIHFFITADISSIKFGLSFFEYWHDQIMIITPGSAILEF